MYTVKGESSFSCRLCSGDLIFMYFSPKEKRICWSLLTRVDPCNVTVRIHTLLDMTSDKRQNQANKTSTSCSKRIEQRFILLTTDSKIVCVKPPREQFLLSCDRAAFLFLSDSSYPNCLVICNAK